MSSMVKKDGLATAPLQTSQSSGLEMNKRNRLFPVSKHGASLMLVIQVNAFIVRKGRKGLKATKIPNKTALRCVQNADIELDDVFVADQDRLPGVNSFRDTNKVTHAPYKFS